MKVKTKVKAGPRDCAIYIWCCARGARISRAVLHPRQQEENDMKIKTKVRASRGCTGDYI